MANQSTELQQAKEAKRFTYRLNYSPDNTGYKKEYKPSKTIPDQTMSIKELIARHQRGLPLAGKQPVYGIHESAMDDEAFQMPVNRNLDLAEREQLMDHNAREIQRLQETAKSEALLAKQQKQKLKEDQEKQQFEKFKNMFSEQKTKGSEASGTDPK